VITLEPSTTPVPLPPPPLVDGTGLARSYGHGTRAVHALRGVDVAVAAGTFTAVMGPSGSGKTTLLHLLAGIDRPTAGAVRWDGTDLAGLSERHLTQRRRTQVGLVFQSFNLLPAMTVAQNVALPSRLAGHRVSRAAVERALERVGLSGRASARPTRLSGGQQQRVAIARALVSGPRIVFADEPTGALDRRTGRGVLQLLRDGVDRDGGTCVMVTHDPQAASVADRVLLLADGLLVDELHQPSADTIAHRLALLES
jgi:putative ABC transport system ATP-binding protein